MEPSGGFRVQPGLQTLCRLQLFPVSTVLLALFVLAVLSIPVAVTGKPRQVFVANDRDGLRWVGPRGHLCDLVPVTEVTVAQTRIRSSPPAKNRVFFTVQY